MTNELKRIMQFAGIKTVGELIEELMKYDLKTPVVSTQYTECMTDSGTDMGGDDEVGIRGVCDLGTRIVIDLNRY